MDNLKKLVNLIGVSGDEKHVRDFIIKEAKKYCRDVSVDKMGNVVAHKKGKRPAIMLAAHMDEIGLISRSVDESGRIFISEIGGVDAPIALGQRVLVLGKQNVKGIITTTEVANDEKAEKIKMEDLFIDTGLNKRELQKRGVRVGTFVSFDPESCGFSYLGSKDSISGKALDDRIGCFILLELLRTVKTSHELFFVFTVQEEVGLYGAKASVFNADPDYAIAVDVTGHDDKDRTLVLGNGPVLTIKDAELIGNKCLNEAIEEVADKLKIPLQLEVTEAGTTDATSIFVAKGGIPSSVFGVSVKNLHTTIGISNLRDISQTIKVLQNFLKSPPNKCWA